jgi:hypothetical protein
MSPAFWIKAPNPHCDTDAALAFRSGIARR